MSNWLDNASEIWAVVQRGTDMTLCDNDTGKWLAFETEFDAMMQIAAFDDPSQYEPRRMEIERS